jgi:hypothetical protein
MGCVAVKAAKAVKAVECDVELKVLWGKSVLALYLSNALFYSSGRQM